MLGLVVCDTLTYNMGAMSNFDVPSVSLGKVGLSFMVRIFFEYCTDMCEKIRFATNYFFDVGMYWPKLSMLALYFQLVPITLQKLRMGVYAATGFTVCCALVTFFADTFWCGPDPRVQWHVVLFPKHTILSANSCSKRAEELTCSAFTSAELLNINWSMNFVTEVMSKLLSLRYSRFKPII